MSKQVSSLAGRYTHPALAGLVLAFCLLALTFLAPIPAFADPPINLSIGDLPPGETVTITFRAVITSSFVGSTPTITNQGRVTSNFAPLVTDDPTTLALGGPDRDPGRAADHDGCTGHPAERSRANRGDLRGLAGRHPAGPAGVTVNYASAGSTALFPDDFVIAAVDNIAAMGTTTFTIEPGATSATVHIVPVERCDRRGRRDDCRDPAGRIRIYRSARPSPPR